MPAGSRHLPRGRERLAAIVARDAAGRDGGAGAVRPDLWHEILFYMVGKAVEEAVPGYVAYADSNDLWRRAWPSRDREVIARHLDPWLAGSGRLDEALTALARDLAAGQ